MKHYLDFEKPIADIDAKIAELKATQTVENEKAIKTEIAKLYKKADKQLTELYNSLSPLLKCQVARHSDRPHCTDYVKELFTEQTPLAGDRAFAEDTAISGYLARFKDSPVVIIGHEKGHDTKSRLYHNFGMARPEGYRKAIRLISLAERFRLPVISLVDTPGAYPGMGAEERGQAEAIARTIDISLNVGVPLISIITGEGGSGGAVALATSDRTAMLEHSIYSVISPEGCASILWKDSKKMPDAAYALKLTANDMIELGIIDLIISEPLGGAHRNCKEAITAVGKTIEDMLNQVRRKRPETLIRERRRKYMAMGTKSSKPKRRRLHLT